MNDPETDPEQWKAAVQKTLSDAESAIAGEVIRLWEEGQLPDLPYDLSLLLRRYVAFSAAANA